jgi:mono/diheme cytochrome c family protein
MRLRFLVALILVVTLVIIISGCSAQTPANTGSTTVSTSTTSSPSLTPGGDTFGQMAGTGASVFTSKCASCHGDNGQGVTAPAIIGAGASLGKYNTAQGLLSYISAAMPANAPGSLSHQDYLNVLSHLLVKNNKVSSDTTFNESDLGNISLK